jgi:SAM-dependent methyltransferase
VSEGTLYGEGQSWFARLLERRQERRPDLEARELRRRLLSGLRGRVVEIGCGEGRAFELYPAAVEHVLVVEPDPAARIAAAGRAAEAPVRVDVAEGYAERLPLADGSVDAAVCVWVLCSVPDPAEALADVRRVLAPGGVLALVAKAPGPDGAPSPPVTPPRGAVAARLFAPVKRWASRRVRHPAPEELRAIVEAAGFDVAELRVAGGWIEIAARAP